MLSAVQEKFSYTLRKLIESHLGILKSDISVTSTEAEPEKYSAEYDAKSFEESTSTSTQLPITTVEDYYKWFENTEDIKSTTEYPLDDEDVPSTTSISTTSAYETLSDHATDVLVEFYDENEGSGSSSSSPITEIVTDATTESTESSTTEESESQSNSRQSKKDNSFSDLWGADLDELDDILNNRLKKSYEYVTPDSLVTRRDVSYLNGRQFIEAARHTYLPPISLRPPVQPTTQALNFYQV